MRSVRSVLPLHRKDAAAGTSTNNNGTTGQTNEHGHNGAQHSRNRSLTQKWRNELVAAAAEFVGTFMFLFFAFGGTQVANSAAVADNAATAGQDSSDNSLTQQPNTSVLLYISLIFGFSLMVNVWVFFRVSGGLFNPAVSL